MDVAREYGSYEILETKLAAVVEEKVKTVFAGYSAMPLLENRANLSAEVVDKLKTLQDLYHIEFTTAVVNNIDFSDAFEACKAISSRITHPEITSCDAYIKRVGEVPPCNCEDCLKRGSDD